MSACRSMVKLTRDYAWYISATLNRRPLILAVILKLVGGALLGIEVSRKTRIVLMVLVSLGIILLVSSHILSLIHI